MEVEAKFRNHSNSWKEIFGANWLKNTQQMKMFYDGERIYCVYRRDEVLGYGLLDQISVVENKSDFMYIYCIICLAIVFDTISAMVVRGLQVTHNAKTLLGCIQRRNPKLNLLHAANVVSLLSRN
ncbi:hypothetical protein AVEN_82630-1 [Araneus ventricosus]|uniref:Uncharacterized protein n=1 Tax=Araneus ventricosus TaxID=182803 RepID=A0A4Y2SC82_ARAVE|nr:hypothetical protein AVEN_82630-1 [Araneus ventricosus]